MIYASRDGGSTFIRMASFIIDAIDVANSVMLHALVLIHQWIVVMVIDWETSQQNMNNMHVNISTNKQQLKYSLWFYHHSM